MTKPGIDHISRATFLLWGIELFLCFVMVDFILTMSVTSGLNDTGRQYPVYDAAAAIALTICFISLLLGLYRPEVCLEVRATMVNAAAGAIVALPFIVLFAELSNTSLGRTMSNGVDCLPKILAAWGACLLLTRSLFTGATRRNLFVRRVLLVGSDEDVRRKADLLEANRNPFFRAVGAVPPSELPSLDPVELKRQKISGIVVADRVQTVAARDELLRCKQAGLHIFKDREFCEQQLHRLDIEALPADWLLFEGSDYQVVIDAFWRLIDVVISLELLLLTLPMTLLVALAIKLDSPGPVFYRQERVGLHGRIFLLYKFRSMRVDAEAASGPAWASLHDPRVSRVGRILRRSRIDELPQILNVLRGEMAFIGPRPERPHFVQILNMAIPNYSDRACVKPGITGWAQINYPYGASVQDAYMKLSYDLYYVKHRGFLLNLFILISTARVVLFQEGSR